MRTEHGALATRVLRDYAAPIVALCFIVAGAWLRLAGYRPASVAVWMAGLVIVGGPVVYGTLRHVLRRHFATDLVATLAIVAAVILLEPLAGLVVALMQTGGEALERYAEGRASRSVRELEAAAPRIAHRIGESGTADVPVEAIEVGDRLFLRPGELVPCDSLVIAGQSDVDASNLTGEPVPINAVPGVSLMSGSINGSGALELRAEALAAESQYARIVQLVRSAQASKAPLQRMADRYAVWFTPATLAVCLVAYIASADPVRILAVLVVATPCPLILATPVAIIGGINRAARRSIIVRTGTALEQIGQCTTVMFDKTGTITVGMPQVREVLAFDGRAPEQILSLAGSVEESSSHPLARALVQEARTRGVPLERASDTHEYSGRGVTGTVGGHRVAVGAQALIEELYPEADVETRTGGGNGAVLRALVTVDGHVDGAIEYADAVRPGVRVLLERLRSRGLRRIALLSGDSLSNAAAIGAEVGIAEVHGDLLPADKVQLVTSEVERGEKVMMVGDGTNDAPALAAATVGIAMGGHGGGITTESADIVLLVDDVSRVGDAVEIGTRTLRIARQSIWAGLGLSAAAMFLAALGHIPPTIGALIQEGIDVAVILNALRASFDV